MMNDENTNDDMAINEGENGDNPDFIALADTDSDEIGKELTATMNSMPLQARVAGLHDIHGVGGIEEKSFVEEQRLVNKMRLRLSETIGSRAAAAFQMADARSPAYTRDPNFLLMFLRCENYNIDASLRRLFTFFEQKLDLFGPDRVGKKMITLSDLSASDMISYSAGFFQLLPTRDHTGRAQFVTLPQFYTWDRDENKVRRVVVVRKNLWARNNVILRLFTSSFRNRS